MVQGLGDEVCPDIFARQFVAGLKAARVEHTAHFIEAGHVAGSAGMSKALRACVDDFVGRGLGVARPLPAPALALAAVDALGDVTPEVAAAYALGYAAAASK